MNSQTEYLVGTKEIAKFFGIDISLMYLAIKWGGVPGIEKVDTQRGGRQTTVLDKGLALQYRHTRENTDKYNPANVTQRLLKAAGSMPGETLPDLIESGLLTDLEWCEALDTERARCNMSVPILMHPADFNAWLRAKLEQRRKLKPIRVATQEIFNPERGGLR